MNLASTDERDFCLTLHRAIVADKNNQRLLAQAEAIEFGHELSSKFIHIRDIIGIEIFAVGRAVGSRENLGVDMRERIINEERLFQVFFHELHKKFVHHVRHVFLVLQCQSLTVHEILSALLLGIPVNPAPLVGKVSFKSKIGGSESELGPFADRR